MSEPRSAAYFDFDRTIHDGDAGVLFGQELMRIRRRQLREQDRGTIAWAARNLAFESRLGRIYAEAILLHLGAGARLVKRSLVIRTAYEKLKGMSVQELRDLARDFVDEVMVHRIFPEARAEMRRHREERRRIVVVSTGMRVLLDPIRDHLPVDDLIAVDLVDKGGILSGGIRGPLWGEEKAKAVRQFAHEQGLSLPRSYAYSDHRSDIPLLRLVGHPVAVNPGFALAVHARRKDWPIQRWGARTD